MRKVLKCFGKGHIYFIQCLENALCLAFQKSINIFPTSRVIKETNHKIEIGVRGNLLDHESFRGKSVLFRRYLGF